MAPFYCSRALNALLFAGVFLGICLSINVRVNAQQSGGGAYYNLKKLSVPSDRQPVRPALQIGTTGLYRAATIRHHRIVAEKPPVSFPDLAILRWSADDLPFFCRIEHNLGLKTQIPIKFRLGSVEYVDWLEGKREY